MPVDHIRYDILVQDALRGMVREVLAETIKKGLPGEHHFFITFDTTAEGVRMSDRLRAQYPEEMTVVLQHQFWDLKVSDDTFEVGLSFGGVGERLVIPFLAIRAFADPSVQFTLQFESLAETPDEEAGSGAETDKSPTAARGTARNKRRTPAARDVAAPGFAERGSVGAETKRSDSGPRETAPTGVPAPAPAATTPEGSPDPQGGNDKPGAEVVRLDRFRKK